MIRNIDENHYGSTYILSLHYFSPLLKKIFNKDKFKNLIVFSQCIFVLFCLVVYY